MRRAALIVFTALACKIELNPNFIELASTGTTSRPAGTTTTTPGDSTQAGPTSDPTQGGSGSSGSSADTSTSSNTSDATSSSTSGSTGPSMTSSDSSTTSGDNEHTIFITSTITDGAFGGIDVADAICAGAASGKLTGTFRAIVSVDGDAAADRLVINGPVRTVLGDLVASDGPDLWDTMIATPVDVNELGQTDVNVNAWTGTTATGQVAADHCSNWTDAGPQADGMRGLKGQTGSGWIAASNGNCNMGFHLYCIEQ